MKNYLIVILLLFFTLFANADLNWQPIDEIRFNSFIDKENPTEKTAAEKAAIAEVESIWGDEIAALGDESSYILLAKAETADNRYIFTMLDSIHSDCINPPNGDGTDAAMPLYSTCDMVVIQQNRTTKVINKRSYPDFCYLNLAYSAKELAENHNEIAIDQADKVAYFRTIMYGKVAAECDQSIQLQ